MSIIVDTILVGLAEPAFASEPRIPPISVVFTDWASMITTLGRSATPTLTRANELRRKPNATTAAMAEGSPKPPHGGCFDCLHHIGILADSGIHVGWYPTWCHNVHDAWVKSLMFASRLSESFR